ncbi:hypothetical protein [Mesorhizobium sp. CO1-1-9]|uniref:hypothetical protein n=1 Tax=Mesorhizobium sp. CO1-1-9 TaxID=2876630 RepID=UPI001CCA8BE6|nr:hypothetical protein [Mesorhizobium sp. CO1-1-9]MBZ9698811.1 hypothetical protein [Mesorhizobium sp. CO1-1-9]
MIAPQPEKVGESRSYWTHKVDTFPSPVAQFRMAQLIDLDDRLYETARVVYRFLVGWYHDAHGDALMSQRYVAKVMKQRAPVGATVPSRNAVQRAIIALMDTGWVVRTFQGRGRGKGASRYVPVLNVLELAAQGKFPEPAHSIGPVEPAHGNGPLVARANGPVDAEPAHDNGPKTLLPDSRTDAKTGKEDIDCAPPAVGLVATASAQGGIEELYSAYGLRTEFAAARLEYEKVAPDATLHAEMVIAAKAWRAAAGEIERMHLARWIREGRYREDPKGERKTKPAAERPAEAFKAGNDNATKKRDQEYIIEKADVDEDRLGNKSVKFMMRGCTDGLCRPRIFCVVHRKAEIQKAAMEELVVFANACGVVVGRGLDAEDFVGRRVLITADNEARQPVSEAA